MKPTKYVIRNRATGLFFRHGRGFTVSSIDATALSREQVDELSIAFPDAVVMTSDEATLSRFPSDKWVSSGSLSVHGATARRLASEGKLESKLSPYQTSAFYLYKKVTS